MYSQQDKYAKPSPTLKQAEGKGGGGGYTKENMISLKHEMQG